MSIRNDESISAWRVFVTQDGAETVPDIGHYERFLDTDMNKFSSFTSGKLYEKLL